MTLAGGDRATPEGWIVLPVPPDVEARAMAMRERRDRDYPNIYEVADTDLRWVGEVGELVFYRWLRENAAGAGSWIRNRPAGKPDFLLHGHRVGLKTVKRKVPFRAGYTAQITARHATEAVDHFFFASYESPARRLWLLGGIPRELFLARARYYGEGEQVHPHYTIRRGHEIYNVEARHLTPPGAWMRALAAEPGPHAEGFGA